MEKIDKIEQQSENMKKQELGSLYLNKITPVLLKW
jgi:hypothetical protein